MMTFQEAFDRASVKNANREGGSYLSYQAETWQIHGENVHCVVEYLVDPQSGYFEPITAWCK